MFHEVVAPETCEHLEF